MQRASRDKPRRSFRTRRPGAIESRQTTEKLTTALQIFTAIYLDPLEKALVILFLEDLSYEQMAEATGMSANHVGVMLHRAKKRLSGLMMEEAPQ